MPPKNPSQCWQQALASLRQAARNAACHQQSITHLARVTHLADTMDCYVHLRQTEGFAWQQVAVLRPPDHS